MEKRVKGVLPMDRSEQRVSPSLSENLIYFRNSFAESSDFLAREFQLNGTDGCVFSMDNLVDKQTVAQSILNPLLSAPILELSPCKNSKQFLLGCFPP